MNETEAPTYGIFGFETKLPTPEPDIDITTVFEVIANQSDLSNFTAAAALAGLTEALCIDCNYTVFAPTDEAFGKLNPKLLTKLLTAPWILHLRQVLANHAEVGAVLAANVVDGPISMLSGENVTVTIDGDAVTIASAGSPDDATVVETDLMDDNGVIHKVDGVLLPSFVSTDLIGLANSTSLGGDFTLFFKYFEAIGGAALLGAIGDEGVTVFAPTDEAFAALGEETLANLSQAELTQILSNHLLRGVLPSFAFSDGQMINSLGGLELTFALVNGSIYANGANITMANVLANNGIFHAINMVLPTDSAPQLEPSPMATPVTEVTLPSTKKKPASEQVDTRTSSNDPNLYLLSLLALIAPLAAWFYQKYETKPTGQSVTQSVPSATATDLPQSRSDPDGLAPAHGIRDQNSTSGGGPSTPTATTATTARNDHGEYSDKDEESPTAGIPDAAMPLVAVAAALGPDHGPDYKDQCRMDPDDIRAVPVLLANAVLIDNTEEDNEEDS
jgi:uncharacterized surface protein with fasciclin (FAS1) repeats